jgi:hypothetical protein
MAVFDPWQQALIDEGVVGTPLEKIAMLTRGFESGGRNDAVSNRGARGQMQVMPGTFGDVADPGWNIDDPYHNARAGIRYLKKGWEASGGDPKLTGAYYYGGPGGMAKAKQGIAVSDPQNPNYPTTIEYGERLANSVNGLSAVSQARSSPNNEVSQMNTPPNSSSSMLPNAMAALLGLNGVANAGGEFRSQDAAALAPDAMASLNRMRETKARMLPIAMGALMSSNTGANQFGQSMIAPAMSSLDPIRMNNGMLTPDGQYITDVDGSALTRSLIGASKPSSNNPYYQPIHTADGVMAFNNRTGTMEPVLDANGKPIIGMQTDVGLQQNLAGAKRSGQVEGERTTNERLDAPKELQDAEYTIRLIDSIINHPGREIATGASRLLGVHHIPGTKAKDFEIALEQIQGQQFLKAFESLKGGGQITEIEGIKATQAMARMNAAGSEKAFLEAALEFREILVEAAKRARMQVESGGAPNINPPNAGDEGLTPEELAELEELRQWQRGGQQ